MGAVFLAAPAALVSSLICAILAAPNLFNFAPYCLQVQQLQLQLGFVCLDFLPPLFTAS
jgi:hypothetical protein